MNLGYVRISTQKQSLNTSLENQRNKINDYCKLHDLPLDNIFEEIDSGGNDDRIVFNKLKELIQNELINTIIIYKLDRLSRSMLGGLQFIQFCKDNNVRVISISDNIDTTDGGKSELLLNILLSIATEEKRMIKERCSSGRDMKWKNKELPYGKISFGYKRVKNGSLELDNNSEIVKYIFTKWNALLKLNLTKTKRTQKMLKLLANRGYTYFGNPFKGYHLKQILQNKFYCGIMRWKNEEQTSGYDSIISLRLYNQIQNSFNN